MRKVGVSRAAHDGAAGGGTYADCGRWKCKSQEDYLVTDDRLSGSAKNIGGQVEEGFGEVTGDVKTQLQGKAKQMEGTLQDVYGQAKETAADAAETIRESASEAGDFLRTTIEERPYTTAAIALATGFLIGRFGHRSDY
jgi:uncharacterized protein YjbJ (UPF0337 family)